MGANAHLAANCASELNSNSEFDGGSEAVTTRNLVVDKNGNFKMAAVSPRGCCDEALGRCV